MTQALQDIRDAVRDLGAQFPSEYFRKVDEQRAYPAEFGDALTKAGWMAALIPQEYGGSGLGLTGASVIMEEVNRAGGNSGACHGQTVWISRIQHSDLMILLARDLRPGQHGQIPSGQGLLGSRQCLPAVPRRLRICLRV